MSNNTSILLVEDDEIDIENIKRCFKKAEINYHLHIAKDGLEALNMLKGEDGYKKINPTPTIMLLDINMPRMNGLELLQEVRQDAELKKISALMLTTSNAKKDIISAYELNAAGYFLKPVDSESSLDITNALKKYWSLQVFPDDE